MRYRTRNRLHAAATLLAVVYVCITLAAFPLGHERLGVWMSAGIGALIALVTVSCIATALWDLVKQLWTGEIE